MNIHFTFKTLASFILSIMVVNASAQDSTCITVKGGPTNSANADVLSSSPTVTNRSTEYFQAAQWTYGGTPGESRDMLWFNLSNIPAGVIITSATLNLYADTTSGNGNTQGTADATNLLRITSPWTDSTVTWNTQPSTTTAGEVLLPQSTSANENYLNLDVSSMVQVWVDSPSKNYGIMSQIISPNYYNHLIFCSGHNADSTLWPALNICYNYPAGIASIGTDINTLQVYPNPTNGQLLTIILPAAMDIGTSNVMIYDMLGREIEPMQIRKETDRFIVSMGADMRSGVYTLTVSNGKKNASRKVVITE
jgi:hypothetical protein